MQLPPHSFSSSSFSDIFIQIWEVLPRLLTSQKGSISALSREIVQERKIAAFIIRLKTAVHNVLAGQGVQRVHKKMVRPKLISNTQLRALFRHASTERPLQGNSQLLWISQFRYAVSNSWYHQVSICFIRRWNQFLRWQKIIKKSGMTGQSNTWPGRLIIGKTPSLVMKRKLIWMALMALPIIGMPWELNRDMFPPASKVVSLSWYGGYCDWWHLESYFISEEQD